MLIERAAWQCLLSVPLPISTRCIIFPNSERIHIIWTCRVILCLTTKSETINLIKLINPYIKKIYMYTYIQIKLTYNLSEGTGGAEASLLLRLGTCVIREEL